MTRLDRPASSSERYWTPEDGPEGDDDPGWDESLVQGYEAAVAAAEEGQLARLPLAGSWE